MAGGIMTAKTCFFLGHADAPRELLPALSKTIERHIIEYGVTEFFFGFHGQFDGMAREALRQAHAAHPQIRRLLVTPYHPAEHPIQKPQDVEELCYPFDSYVPPRYAISRANRQMIGRCDYLIAYVCHPGRARTFWAYAQQREAKGLLRAENLAAGRSRPSPKE